MLLLVVLSKVLGMQYRPFFTFKKFRSKFSFFWFLSESSSNFGESLILVFGPSQVDAFKVSFYTWQKHLL
jgi:hypothetical protein